MSARLMAWRALLASGAASRRDAAEGDLSGSLQNRNVALQKLGNGLFSLHALKRTRRYCPVCDAVGGWSMRDPLSADDPTLSVWRGMVEPTIADDDAPILSHATKLIIAVAVFALGVPIGAAIAAWVMPPS